MQSKSNQNTGTHLENETTNGDSGSTLPNHHFASDHPLSIPSNPEGSRYSMKQAFAVWFDNKDKILADVSVEVKHGENYKLARPQQIYHLDLFDAKQYSSVDKFWESSGSQDELRTPGESALPTSVPIQPPNLSKANPVHASQQEDTHASVLVASEDISWLYLDPAGNEQGPFSGDVMQEWLSDGYLSLDLQIRRKEEHSYQSLKQFCEKVQNYVQPFKVPLPPVSVTNQQRSSQELLHSTNSVDDTSSRSGHATGLGQANSFQSVCPQPNPFGQNLYSQILPNGTVGAANIRSSSSNPLFDFMSTTDYSLSNPQYSANQFGIEPMNQNINSAFGQLHMPSLLQHQISSQQPSLSRSSSGWGIDNSLQGSIPNTPGSAPSSMGLGQATLSQSTLKQQTPISPWVNRVQPLSRVSSPFVPTATLDSDSSTKINDNMLSDLHSSMVSGILRDEEITRSVPAAQNEGPNDPSSQQKQNFELTPKTNSDIESHEREAMIENFEVETNSTNEGAQDLRKENESQTSQNNINASPGKNTDISPKVAPQPAPAPWASSKSTNNDAPVVTLKQMQELEADRAQREKQLRAEMKQEIALANALAASKLDEKVPEKLTFHWATTSQPATAKKSLAEIQKEEEAESLRLKAAKTQGSASKTSLASTIAITSNHQENDGAWTTVTSKKPVKKSAQMQPQFSVSYSALSSSLNPQALRNASSTFSSSSSINTNAVKEEFLIWARSAMTNLYPSVSKNDLLEIFTTLPLHGDSAQLIAETIYSSSATMDGRRFAQEFMKKRQQVEKQIGASASESWSSAIVSSANKVPTVDDDGWSTSVKSKKKVRKN